MPLIVNPLWDGQVNDWVSTRGGGRAAPDSYRALGWYDPTQGIVGGIIFYSANSANCFANIALSPSFNPRGLIRAGLTYAFGQLGLRRLTFFIAWDNIASIKFVTALGALHEASLRDAEPEGDLHIYALFPDSCPIWERIRGKKR